MHIYHKQIQSGPKCKQLPYTKLSKNRIKACQILHIVRQIKVSIKHCNSIRWYQMRDLLTKWRHVIYAVNDVSALSGVSAHPSKM